MSFKKTLPMPVVSEGVPVITDARPSQDRTREIVGEGDSPPHDEPPTPGVVPGVPKPITADDITVPVHSSIESSLTFEVLRRQSTNNDDEGDKTK
jgi:hypothetical protein